MADLDDFLWRGQRLHWSRLDSSWSSLNDVLAVVRRDARMGFSASVTNGLCGFGLGETREQALDAALTELVGKLDAIQIKLHEMLRRPERG